MKSARALLLSILVASPCVASAELPMLIALDGRTKAGIERMLRRVGYPEASFDAITGPLVGVLWRGPHPTPMQRNYRGEGDPFISATSRRSGPCLFAELTAWFADGSRPPIRLSGRYCRSRNPAGVIFEARSQRIRILSDGEAPPPPGTGAERE